MALVFTWPALAPTDPDYWWHVRTGRLIVETGGVPRVDPYSFTAAGQPWVAHEWLTELIFYVVQHQFGFVGNVVLIGVLGSLAAVALWATCRLWGLGELASVVLVLWAFGMSLGSLGVRPQAISRVMLTVLALLLTLYRRDRDWRWLVGLPLFFLVWVNLHGGFAVGLGLLILMLIGETFEARSRWNWRPRDSVRGAWCLALVTLVSAAVTLINPNGVAGVLYPLAYVQQATGGQHLILEWQAPDLRQLSFAPFGLSLLLALALGFWPGRTSVTRREVLVEPGVAGKAPAGSTEQCDDAAAGALVGDDPLAKSVAQRRHAPAESTVGWRSRAPRLLGVVELLWALAFALLALQSIRNIQLYATVLTPLIGARLVSVSPAFGRTIAEWRRPRHMAVLWAIVSLLSAAIWFGRFTQATDWPVQLGAEPDAQAFPVGGAAYLRDHDLQGNLFNQFEWGGYLIYTDYPQEKVFIDGRPDMYGQALFDEYVTIATLQPAWRERLDARQIKLVLVDKDSPLAIEIARDPGWTEVYSGPVERLFERT